MASNSEDYSVGLDIGTGSVGWAVMDDRYRLLHKKGKALIGTRLFDSAQSAAERRGYRTTRRRLARRRWRIRLLNEIFSPELIAFGDDNFLSRLKWSWVHPKDAGNKQHFYNGRLFDTKEDDKKFYKNYPTIYHLRQALMNDTKKHDLREIYLAIHHIVKYRGHFLIEGSVRNDSIFNVNDFVSFLKDFIANKFEGVVFSVDSDALSASLTDTNSARTQRAANAHKSFTVVDSDQGKMLQALLQAVVGNQVNLITIFGLDAKEIDKDTQNKFKFKFSDTDIDSKLNDLESDMNVDDFSFVEKLKEFYDGLTLKQLLGEDHTISDAMVRRYKEHHNDWDLIKKNVRNDDNANDIDQSYIDLQGSDDKKIKKALALFKSEIENSSLDQNSKEKLIKKIDDDKFLPLQRTKDNGTIPHQLHANELEKIISNQAAYYPFLKTTFKNAEGQENNKIIALVNFRVPFD